MTARWVILTAFSVRFVGWRWQAGLQRDRRVLPDALPGGPRDGGVRPARPQARHHRPGPRLARRRRARLRLLALVAAHRPHAAVSTSVPCPLSFSASGWQGV